MSHDSLRVALLNLPCQTSHAEMRHAELVATWSCQLSMNGLQNGQYACLLGMIPVVKGDHAPRKDWHHSPRFAGAGAKEQCNTL